MTWTFNTFHLTSSRRLNYFSRVNSNSGMETSNCHTEASPFTYVNVRWMDEDPLSVGQTPIWMSGLVNRPQIRGCPTKKRLPKSYTTPDLFFIPIWRSLVTSPLSSGHVFTHHPKKVMTWITYYTPKVYHFAPVKSYFNRPPKGKGSDLIFQGTELFNFGCVHIYIYVYIYIDCMYDIRFGYYLT